MHLLRIEVGSQCFCISDSVYLTGHNVDLLHTPLLLPISSVHSKSSVTCWKWKCYQRGTWTYHVVVWEKGKVVMWERRKPLGLVRTLYGDRKYGEDRQEDQSVPPQYILSSFYLLVRKCVCERTHNLTGL